MQSGTPEKKEDLNLQSVLADLNALVLKGKQLEVLEAELQAAKATCANQAAQLTTLTAENAQFKEQIKQLQQTLEERDRQEEKRIQEENTPAARESRERTREMMVQSGKVPWLEKRLKEKRQALEIARTYFNDPGMRMLFGSYPQQLQQALQTNNQEIQEQAVEENKRDRELASLNEKNVRLSLENADLKFQLQKANEIVNSPDIKALLSM